MLALETHIALAQRELAAMPGAAPDWLAGQVTTLALCDSFGQLVVYPPTDDPSGFICWLRSSLEHRHLFRDRDFDAVRRLSREELTRGPALFVAETWARRPGLTMIAARELGHLPGVELLCAYIQGGRPVAWRWRERRVRQRGH